MQSLNLFLIHSPKLTLREQRMHLTVKQLEQVCQKNNYRMRVFKIDSFEPNDLQPKLEEISKQIRYDKTGDEDFDRGLQPLSVQQLSNFYKQKEALKQKIANGFSQRPLSHFRRRCSYLTGISKTSRSILSKSSIF